MQIEVNVGSSVDVKPGDIVQFPQYGTTYIVHKADKAAAEQRKEIEPMLTHKVLYQLYRFDGLKPYQRVPFTQEELEYKISVLGGLVYSKDEYKITITKK